MRSLDEQLHPMNPGHSQSVLMMVTLHHLALQRHKGCCGPPSPGRSTQFVPRPDWEAEQSYDRDHHPLFLPLHPVPYCSVIALLAAVGQKFQSFPLGLLHHRGS